MLMRIIVVVSSVVVVVVVVDTGETAALEEVGIVVEVEPVSLVPTETEEMKDWQQERVVVEEEAAAYGALEEEVEPSTDIVADAVVDIVVGVASVVSWRHYWVQYNGDRLEKPVQMSH